MRVPHAMVAGRLSFVTVVAAGLSANAAPWSLSEVIERASTTAPEVKVAGRVLQEAEATRVGAGVFLPSNPRLFADYRRLASPPPIDPLNGYNLGIDGTFEVSGAGWARLDEAERRVSLARSELATAQSFARVRAWQGFIAVKVAVQRVAITEAALVIAARVEAATRERLRNGVVGEPDVLAASLEHTTVRVQLEDARRTLQAASAALCQVLDLDADAALELVGELAPPPPGGEEDALVQRALEKRPELASVKARLSLLEATDSRLVREAFPHVTFNLGFDAAPASPVFGYAGLGIQLPVAQRNQGPRAVNQAQLETERVRLETELRRVRREVASARRSYQARLTQLQLLSNDALPAAERFERLVEEGWVAGRFDLFRLTSATRDLNRVRGDRLETLLAAWTDFIELERASGGLNP